MNPKMGWSARIAACLSLTLGSLHAASLTVCHSGARIEPAFTEKPAN